MKEKCFKFKHQKGDPGSDANDLQAVRLRWWHMDLSLLFSRRSPRLKRRGSWRMSGQFSPMEKENSSMSMCVLSGCACARPHRWKEVCTNWMTGAALSSEKAKASNEQHLLSIEITKSIGTLEETISRSIIAIGKNRELCTAAIFRL